MAIEFLRAVVLTRGKNGRGVPAHMAYRSCSRVYDEQQDRTFDYSNKKSVLDAFLINAGDNTLEELANKMEKSEKRKDAQVARELILALPHELSLECNTEICREFVNLMVKKYNVAAHVAIHKPDESIKDEINRENDSYKNVHAHITVTMRSVDKDGNIIGLKIREMNDRGYLESLKNQTREIINNILKREGFEPMAMRDENQKATRQVGPELTRMERRGNSSVKGDKNRFIEKINGINLLKQSLVQEEEVLKTGKITIEGVTYKNYPYPKGKEIKPYSLAFKNYDQLCKEMREGRLRVKERYDTNMIRSFIYMGQKITIAELTLINPIFSNVTLPKFEQQLNNPIKKFKMSESENKEEHRRKKIMIGFKQRGFFNKPLISRNNINLDIKEAHWHGKQAAFTMDQNTNL